MGGVAEMAFALMAGITVSGIVGSLMELATGRALSFSEPYFSSRRILRSIASAACAGPMMLANDAIFARRQGAISTLYLGFCVGTALVWATALGIVAIGLAGRLPGLL
ncbi:DUF6949 family protein [Mesorhizobium sp. IMUNJ 23232]|uniref:DUF6949 family protein n=1 Tax=Mesorhizobium sp. IMUNJ 23232 TaxID=3376064 RepID=UPI00378EA651